MASYAVTKYFGHFAQGWFVKADSEEEAWNTAETNGYRQYQGAYREPMDIESKGYVVNLDEKRKTEEPIPVETYHEWLLEAVDLGMIVRPEELEKALKNKRSK